MALWEERPDAWHDVQPGVRRRIVSHDERMMLVLYDIAPNTTIKSHSHPQVQQGLVFEGGGTLTLAGTTYPLVRGSSYLIPGGVAHELRTPATGQTVILDAFTPRRDDLLKEAVTPDRA